MNKIAQFLRKLLLHLPQLNEKRCDELLQQLQQCERRCLDEQQRAMEWECRYGIEKEEWGEKLKKTQLLLQKQEKEYNLIDFPVSSLKDIEKKLTIADKLTIQILIEYLILDEYELVKNLAKITNEGNASNIIAYRDGALGRNRALLDKLSSLRVKDMNYNNRIVGDIETK